MTISSKNAAKLNDEATSSSDHVNSSLTSRTVSLVRSITNFSGEIDMFGFYLTPKQFCVVMLLATIMLRYTAILFILVLGLYTIAQRRQWFLSSPSMNQGTRSGAVRWGNGSNIKGLKDLPKQPQGG
mmetsp:Transcript_12344/g.14532  ORF Transcript_12344/g.14532 Transcript_12344/m.14532 type:complete len:127 (+) Transcript_12344:118-498(+)